MDGSARRRHKKAQANPRPTVDQVVAAHGDLERKGGGYAGACPECGGDDRFHVKDRGDGTALIGCRGCIDNHPDGRANYGRVMSNLFPDRTPPPRVNGAREPAPADSVQPKSREGLRACLTALGYEWRYNLRSARAELMRVPKNYRRPEPGEGVWFEANDRITDSIRESISEKFTTLRGGRSVPLRFGDSAWRTAFNALLYERETDPFREWLESLTWHGEQRLDRWLSHVFQVRDDAELAAWAGRFLCLGAVWRTFNPGTKLDEMPVLIGPQGCGKSTALRELLPPEHPEWFGDGLRLAADDKVRAEALQGRVIVEAAEMAGSTRAERESLKAFLSRTDDGAVRLAYRRNPETMLRRCVLAGTSNDPHCLPPDPSGNRRFVAITVRAQEDSAAGVRLYLKQFREQLWAEAVSRYRDGETAYLPNALAAAQATVNASAVSVDESLEDAVLDFFIEGNPTGEAFRLADMKPYIERKLRGDLPSDRRLSVELRRLDCEYIGSNRRDGTKGRWWMPPQGNVPRPGCPG